MENQFARTKLLIGDIAFDKLANSHIAVFGIGGVGSYVVEALARVGIGKLDLIDNDFVGITNINRQLIALHSTIGKPKVEVAKERILDINPDIKINTYKTFFSAENSHDFNFSKYNYIIDAIDSIGSKIELILKAKELNIPIISSMGTGNKLHPELFEITDIYKTSVCPLAKKMRTELKKRNIRNLTVVYSKELPIKEKGQRMPASISFVPSTAGLIIASKVVNDIIKQI